MKISQAGLDLIKECESYLKPLPDGRCTTYLCPAGVATIGWGCTHGVKIGDVWTREEAEEGLRRELAKAEAAVTRLVTVEITQPQFDALVSFVYNCGEGALAGSTILRLLNRGDVTGAANAFRAWNKATVKGKRVELRGLTRRRAAEKALFLSTPDEHPNDLMPQKVDPPGMTTGQVMTAGAAGTGGLGVLTFAPDAINQAQQVKGLMAGMDLATWSVPLLLGSAVIGYLMWARRA